MSIDVTVTEANVLVIDVGAEQGLPGADAFSLTGEVTSAGTAGVSVPVTGFESADDYQVMVCYAENPLGNGVLWCEKSADSFLIKHSGTHHVLVSYVVTATSEA